MIDGVWPDAGLMEHSRIGLLVAAAALAGWVDAVVGGGGLILLPALFGAYPAAPPAALMGTNKAAAIWGTGWAAWRYSQQVRLRWASLAPACGAALLGAGLGAWAVGSVPSAGLRQALPVVLAVVLLYTLVRKDVGRQHAPRFEGRAETGVACGIALAVGFYDGFFGPGTGSFLVFAGVRILGYDFLHASAHAKLLNTSTNLAAIALFASQGRVWWHLALPMAVANVLGSWLGTRTALTRGTGFVRAVFIVVVGALIAKTAWDGWR